MGYSKVLAAFFILRLKELLLYKDAKMEKRFRVLTLKDPKNGKYTLGYRKSTTAYPETGGHRTVIPADPGLFPRIYRYP